MLIKSADDQTAFLEELERRTASTDPVVAKRAKDELLRRRAGLRGEKESTYLIDFDYGQNPNWAVIHDLRLESGGRTAQIDHVLINRWLQIYVLESKHFHAGLKITDDGEFLRWNDFKKTFEGMPSPIQQNERHIAVLRDVVAKIADWPTRLGMRLPASYHNLVLVAPGARIDRSKKFDCSGVIKADHLKKTIWKDIDEEGTLGTLMSVAKMVSAETVMRVAKGLVKLHAAPVRPTETPPPVVTSVAPSQATAQPATHRSDPVVVQRPNPESSAVVATQTGPACKQCGGTAGLILYGRSYYFQCSACHANTSVRVACSAGHQPRIRKSGKDFYRDCPECASSELYFRNSL